MRVGGRSNIPQTPGELNVYLCMVMFWLSALALTFCLVLSIVPLFGHWLLEGTWHCRIGWLEGQILFVVLLRVACVASRIAEKFFIMYAV